jgi:hypothetical protein
VWHPDRHGAVLDCPIHGEGADQTAISMNDLRDHLDLRAAKLCTGYPLIHRHPPGRN